MLGATAQSCLSILRFPPSRKGLSILKNLELQPGQNRGPPSGIFHPLSLFQRAWILTLLQSCAQIPQAKPQLLSPIRQRWEMPN